MEENKPINEPRNQHFVPQTYLRHFACEGAKKPFLWVYDKSLRKEPFPSSTAKIACGEDFYTLTNSEDEFAWEHYYGDKVEPVLSKLLNLICSRCEDGTIPNYAPILNSVEKGELSFCVTQQTTRIMWNEKPMRDRYEKSLSVQFLKLRIDLWLKRDIGSLIRLDLMEKDFRSGKHEEKFKKVAANVSINEPLDRIKRALNDRVFLFLKILGPEFFVASDNPVVSQEFQTKRIYHRGYMLGHSEARMFYPISSRVLLLAVDKTDPLLKAGYQDCGIIRVDGDKSKALVQEANRAQLEHCTRVVCGARKEDLLELYRLDQ